MTSTQRGATAGFLDRIGTLSRSGQEVLARQNSTPERWLLRYRQEQDAAVRLFCFAHAGGGPSVFRSWPADLPSTVDVWGVQLPGRDTRIDEPAYRRMAPLTADLAQAIAPHLDKPFAFFGHSMGALVAFELARELRRAGLPQPARLFLAAFRAPQLPSPNVKIYHWPDEVLKVVLQRDGTPEEVLRNDELMRVLLPTLRADLEVCDTYEYTDEPALDCPFSVFGGTDDVRVRERDLPGWQLHTSSAFSLSMLPGTHFFLNSARQRLIELIRAELVTDGTLPTGVSA